VLYPFGSLLVDIPSRLFFIGKYKGQKKGNTRRGEWHQLSAMEK
jgi:hypothetical protein